jgi:hypothetical protein
LLYETAARANELLALDVQGLDLADRRARVHSKGGAVVWVFWQTWSAQLLPRLLAGRTGGPVFLGDRRPNGSPARVSQRSARVCPPGSRQGAGAAEGLWGPSTTGRGQHHLDRVLGVGLPGGMDRHRPGTRPGPDPVADHLAT